MPLNCQRCPFSVKHALQLQGCFWMPYRCPNFLQDSSLEIHSSILSKYAFMFPFGGHFPYQNSLNTGKRATTKPKKRHKGGFLMVFDPFGWPFFLQMLRKCVGCMSSSLWIQKFQPFSHWMLQKRAQHLRCYAFDLFTVKSALTVSNTPSNFRATFGCLPGVQIEPRVAPWKAYPS